MSEVAATRDHADAMCACASLLVHRFWWSFARLEANNSLERASECAPSTFMASTSKDRSDWKCGVTVLSQAAKEILLCRQCKCAKVE